MCVSVSTDRNLARTTRRESVPYSHFPANSQKSHVDQQRKNLHDSHFSLKTNICITLDKGKEGEKKVECFALSACWRCRSRVD